MAILLSYSIQLLPGILLLCSTYFLLPKKENLLRLFLLILGFILMRDAMTPVGIWEFGINNGAMWLRFIENHFVLLVLAFFSLFLTLGIYKTQALNSYKMNWFGDSSVLKSVFVGILASVLAAGPFLIPYFFTDISARGGRVSLDILISLFIFTMFGNFLEEVLFRGFLQSYLKERTGLKRSILLSALFFAVGHIFLATTVTNLGVLILVFTFWEGLVCASIEPKYGIIASTIAHGLAIFILSSGMI